jgi:hypothetical protein
VAFSIRKNELAAIKAVLTDDTYADEDEMAKALIQTMMAELEKRDSFTYVYKTGDGFITLLWPFWYEKDARKFHEEYGMPDIDGGHTTWRIYKTLGPQERRDTIAKHRAEEAKRVEGLNWPGPGQTLTLQDSQGR